jgi:hypothetical protein
MIKNRQMRGALIGFAVGIFSMGVSAAPVPQEMADKINSLISASPDAINPGLYSLAVNNPDFAGDIACSAIQYYGQASTVAGGISPLLPDSRRDAFIAAVKECPLTDQSGGFGKSRTSFNSGISGGNFNTLENTADSPSPSQP